MSRENLHTFFCYSYNIRLFFAFANENTRKMATSIKTIPILRGKVAETFQTKAVENERNNRGVISFSAQVALAKSILKKANLG